MKTRVEVLRIVRDAMLAQGSLGMSGEVCAPDGRYCALGALFKAAWPDKFAPGVLGYSAIGRHYGLSCIDRHELWKQHDEATHRPDGYLWFLCWLDEQLGDVLPVAKTSAQAVPS